MSEEWQFGFTVKGLVTPLEKKILKDSILTQGIPKKYEVAHSYVFLKAKIDENEDKEKVKDRLLDILKRITQIYSLIINRHTEVISGSVYAKISVENPFGNTKYPPDILKFFEMPSDDQRMENMVFLKKAIEKYELIEEACRVTKRDFLRNAIDYYNRSLGDTRLEEKLIDLMICLESLFSEETDELRLRYSLRLSHFIGIRQENETLRVFQRTYDLYNKRSKVVHGTKKVDLDDGEIASLQINLRDAIKCFLHIELNKKEFLTLLDESVYDCKKKIELKTVVSEAEAKW